MVGRCALRLVLPLFLLCGLSINAEESGGYCPDNAQRRLIIRNDDLSYLSDVVWESRILQMFKAQGLRQSYAVIPSISNIIEYAADNINHPVNGNEALVELLSRYRKTGWVEIIQHGFSHQSNALHAETLKPSKSSEFSGLSSASQRSLLSQGKQMLESAFGIPIAVFVPPWNSHDEVTLEQLRSLGYEFVSSKRLFALIEPSHQIGRTVSLKQLKRALKNCPQEGDNDVLVVLYHSIVHYSEEGLDQLEELTKIVLESGIKVVLFSDLSLESAS